MLLLLLMLYKQIGTCEVNHLLFDTDCNDSITKALGSPKTASLDEQERQSTNPAQNMLLHDEISRGLKVWGTLVVKTTMQTKTWSDSQASLTPDAKPVGHLPSFPFCGLCLALLKLARVILFAWGQKRSIVPDLTLNTHEVMSNACSWAESRKCRITQAAYSVISYKASLSVMCMPL